MQTQSILKKGQIQMKLQSKRECKTLIKHLEVLEIC
jgi:hypothetical protein